MVNVRPDTTLRIVVASLLAVALATIAAADAKVARVQRMEQKMFQLVNQARTEHGREPLRWNEKLGEAAAGHLVRMIEKRNLSHRYPGEPELTGRIAATGLRFNASAENVAFATDWEDLHPGLMDSPGHRANILSEKYDEIGIAIALGPNGYYAVQNFAHTTSEAGAEEAESRWATALRQALRSQVKVTSSWSIRRAVCEMAERDRVEARKLPIDPPHRRMLAYTTVEPDDLPPGLLDGVRGANVKQVELGICYRATEKYPGGIYWVGVVY